MILLVLIRQGCRPTTMCMNDSNCRLQTDPNLHRRDRSNRAKHVTRVAVEYTQLLYHVSKAHEEKCAFVDELQWVKANFNNIIDIFTLTIFF
jgi:hypothetical protein